MSAVSSVISVVREVIRRAADRMAVLVAVCSLMVRGRIRNLWHLATKAVVVRAPSWS